MKRGVSLLLSVIFVVCMFGGCTGDTGYEVGSSSTSDYSKASAEAGENQSVAGLDGAVAGIEAITPPDSGELTTEKSTGTANADNTANTKGTLTVRFIDVGQADSALITTGGRSMLIDGGNVADSSLVASVLKKLSITYLDYVVCTHAHEDHAGGLSGALSVAGVGTVFAPKTGADTKAYKNFIKKVTGQGKTVTHPEAGDSFTLGEAEIKVLAPVDENTSDLNDTSIILLLTFGKTKFLFMGDANLPEETDILDSGEKVDCDVLKVGHHGSDTSTGYRLLREASPDYAVISVGKGNSYGHPDDGTLSKLRDAGVKVYRTDKCGDVVAVSNGKTVTFTTGKNAATADANNNNADSSRVNGNTGSASVAKTTAASKETTQKQTTPPKTTVPPKTTAAPAVQEAYIGNANSKKFHTPSCGTLPKKENRIYFSTRDEAVNSGYTPCKNCNP